MCVRFATECFRSDLADVCFIEQQTLAERRDGDMAFDVPFDQKSNESNRIGRPGSAADADDDSFWCGVHFGVRIDLLIFVDP